MKKTRLLFALMLTATLAACGDKPAPESAEAPADGMAPPMPMSPEEGVAGNVEGSMPAATEAAAPAGPSVDGHGLYTAKCASCHGEMGEGVAKNPKLAGLTVAQLQGKLMDYRAGKQLGPQTAIMAGMAKPLSDAEIEALARYIGE